MLVERRTSAPMVTTRYAVTVTDTGLDVGPGEELDPMDASLRVAYDISGVCDFSRLDEELRSGETPIHAGLTADGSGCFQLIQRDGGVRVLGYRDGTVSAIEHASLAPGGVLDAVFEDR